MLFIVLSRASAEQLEEPAFRFAWGFFFDGYKREKQVTTTLSCPKRYFGRSLTWFAWWESTVLLRKAGIVLLGRLVDSPMLQISFLGVWIAVFLVAHVHYRPYVSDMFQLTEGISLFCILVTALLSIVVYEETDTSPRSVAMTVIMIMMNMVTVAILSFVFLKKKVGKQLSIFNQKATPKTTQWQPNPLEASTPTTVIITTSKPVIVSHAFANPAFTKANVIDSEPIAFAPQPRNHRSLRHL
jgi:hypothetical protein